MTHPHPQRKVPLQPGRWLVQVTEHGHRSTRLDPDDTAYPNIQVPGANAAFDAINEAIDNDKCEAVAGAIPGTSPHADR